MLISLPRYRVCSFICRLLLAFGFASTCTGLVVSDEANQRTKLRIVGYLPEYRGNEIREDWFQQVTDLILFSAEPTADGTLNLDRIAALPLNRITQLAEETSTRVILCVGGWGRSQHFASVSADFRKRSVFVQSALETCLKNKYSGIDLDWEHPQNGKEEADYAKLLHELHVAFKPHALQLSLTMAAWQSIPIEAFASVDFVQVMAYDHDGRHSTLEGAIKDLDEIASKGVPKSSTILGIPLYGRSLTDRNVSLTYQQIMESNQLDSGDDEAGGMYFNGLSTILKKCEYAEDAGLAGVMFWEIAQDAPGDASVLKQVRRLMESIRK